MIFYGTMTCPDCRYAKSVLDKNKIEYEYIDILEDIKTIKEFISIRDNRKEFDELKVDGILGVPCFLMESGEIIFDVDYLVERKLNN